MSKRADTVTLSLRLPREIADALAREMERLTGQIPAELRGVAHMTMHGLIVRIITDAMAPSAPPSVPGRTMKDLVLAYGDRVGRRHGWKSEVAGAIGLHPSTVSRIVTGSRSIDIKQSHYEALRALIDGGAA